MVPDSVLEKVEFLPGFNRNLTTYEADNYYVDGDKVRFRNKKAEKIGGWVRDVVSQASDPSNSLFTGVSRAVFDWVDLLFNKYFVSGSDKKVELYLGGQIFDITPFREENINLEDAITTTSGESIVKIADAAHNLTVGDYVVVDSQETPVDGITLSGEYVVVEVIDVNNYTIDSGVIATGSTASGGDTLVLDYPLQIGRSSNGGVTGYGGGTWDTPGLAVGGYGMPRAGDGGAFLRQWSFDNWGEDLIACVRNGKIYQWDATNDVNTRLQEIANAPTENYLILVGQPYRHLIAFGSQLAISGVFDPLVIRWASQETLTEWDIEENNTAGEYRLPLGNYIVGVVQTRSEIIIFTDNTVYSMRYTGTSEVFKFDILASNVSSIAQHCMVDINGIVYWMSNDGFYVYDGVVRRLGSSLDKYYFDQDGEGRVTLDQKEKVYCSTIKEFNEIIWLAPCAGSEEINRYIIFNYLEGTWYDGTLDRTVWLDQKIFERPFAIDSSCRLLIHEQGKDDDGQPMTAYIRSGFKELNSGGDLLFIDRFIPDFKMVPNRNANMFVHYKMYPNASEYTKGPYIFNNSTNKIDIRVRARQIAIEYRVDALGADFTVGAPRFSFQNDGNR